MMNDMSATENGERITGVMVQYYKSCPRELWFFARQINMNREDDNILIGRQIQEDSYSRDRKEITLGPVKFDLIRKEEDLVVCEVKKSRKLMEPQLYQLYYYLWFLEQRGIKAKGRILYPKQRRRKDVELTPDIEEEMEDILKDIKRIIRLPRPPPAEERGHCEGCSYYEFCKI
jgi:CRISPR-associated exonuclease Cas4